MIKEFPAKVFLVRVYCDKCGKMINTYRTLFAEPIKYEYTCENCGNVQIENILPTYVVKGEIKE